MSKFIECLIYIVLVVGILYLLLLLVFTSLCMSGSEPFCSCAETLSYPAQWLVNNFGFR